MKHKSSNDVSQSVDDIEDIKTMRKSLLGEIKYLSGIIEKYHNGESVNKNITPCTNFDKIKHEYADLVAELESDGFGTFMSLGDVLNRKIHYRNILSGKKSKLGSLTSINKCGNKDSVIEKLIGFCNVLKSDDEEVQNFKEKSLQINKKWSEVETNKFYENMNRFI